MNRVKKEIRKRGFKLENDYPFLPYYIKGSSPFEPGNICLEGVTVNSERATFTQYFNVICLSYTMHRDGEITMN